MLYRVTLDCGRRREPMLSALCVTKNGEVGGGYVGAVQAVSGVEPEQLDVHAAEQRLLCHRHFGTTLPPDGGQSALTAQVQDRRNRPRATRQPVRRGVQCPTCSTEMPVTGTCDFCR